eukprot:1157752-Pelagomonas_calceolata.AAC.8
MPDEHGRQHTGQQAGYYRLFMHTGQQTGHYRLFMHTEQQPYCRQLPDECKTEYAPLVKQAWAYRTARLTDSTCALVCMPGVCKQALARSSSSKEKESLRGLFPYCKAQELLQESSCAAPHLGGHGRRPCMIPREHWKEVLGGVDVGVHLRKCRWGVEFLK